MDKQKRIEELKAKYYVDDKTKEQIILKYIDSEKVGKTPKENPIAVIVCGQSGAGKTVLMHKFSTQTDGVQVDNDAVREFHPQIEEIKAEASEYKKECTDQLSLTSIPYVISYLSGDNPNNEKNNLTIHQTGKNRTIADKAAQELRGKGYVVGFAIMAVSYAESKQSQNERCHAQYKTFGTCRYVAPNDHMDAINGLPSTVGYIEENNMSDFLLVFTRNDKDISEPILQYVYLNPYTLDKTLPILKEYGLPCEEFSNGFESAEDAVVQLRQMDEERCMQTLGDRIQTLIDDGGYEIPGMAPHLDEISAHLKAYTTTHRTPEITTTSPTES